jgi:ABC-type bacteriocin/lantibiotic exporter with double-glycine peptidase domain
MDGRDFLSALLVHVTGTSIVGLVGLAAYLIVRKLTGHRGQSTSEKFIEHIDQGRVRAHSARLEELNKLLNAITKIGTSELLPLLVEALFCFAVAGTIGAFGVVLIVASIFIVDDSVVMLGIKVTSVVLVVIASLFFGQAVIEMLKAKILLETKNRKSSEQEKEEGKGISTTQNPAPRNI